DAGESSQVTDANGLATFSVKPGADRRICEELKTGWHNSDPGSDTAPCETVLATDLESGETANRDLGNYRNATINVTKYDDKNADGDQDAGEPGLSGWTIFIDQDNDAALDAGESSQVTDANGLATFSVKTGADRRI